MFTRDPRLQEKLSNSWPIRRAAQLSVYWFIRAEEKIKDAKMDASASRFIDTFKKEMKTGMKNLSQDVKNRPTSQSNSTQQWQQPQNNQNTYNGQNSYNSQTTHNNSQSTYSNQDKYNSHNAYTGQSSQSSSNTSSYSSPQSYTPNSTYNQRPQRTSPNRTQSGGSRRGR